MAEVEGHFAQTLIGQPNWLPGNGYFWYKRYISSTQFQIIIVGVAKRERKVAFDSVHEAEALRHADPSSGIQPLAWIDSSSSGYQVKLWVGRRCWLYDNKQMRPCEGDTKPPRPQDIVSERRTTSGCIVTFRNETDETLSLTWIDWDGSCNFYTTIDCGSFVRQRTFESHVWQVAGTKSGLIQSLFQASSEPEQEVILRGNSSDNNCTMKALESVPMPTSETINDMVFVNEKALWYKGHEDKDPRKIADGSDDKFYDNNHVYPSPDGRYVAAWQCTPGGDGKLTLVESSPTDQFPPKVHQRPYWRPGEKVSIHRPKLFDLKANREVPTANDLFSNPCELSNIGWSESGSEYRFIYIERGNKIVRLIGFDHSGAINVHIEERRPTFIDPQKLDWRVLKDDNMLWCSERDDYNHLYLVNLENGSISQLTHGNWNVKRIENLNEGDRRVWFSCCGVRSSEDPYYTHLASVKLDGAPMTILTDGNGTHSWTWSPDKIYFTDTWSRVDAAPTTVVRDANSGQKLMDIEKGNYRTLHPERFVAPGRDGLTLIYGVIIRPKHFDSSKRYPVLDDIYAGPQDFFTPKSFGSCESQQRWADEGFVVVRADGMGTNWRGKVFHDKCYKNLRDAGLPDHIEWLKAAAATRPWMDLSRVGIIGTSAGGQNAIAALISHGDFFKVAAADSGCHDNRLDKWWWNERWMGYPVDEFYNLSSNIENAHKIKRPLLLVAGELDDNVDPVCTLRLVHALQQGGKDHELVFVPGGRHGCGSEGFARRRQVAFLRSHLGVPE